MPFLFFVFLLLSCSENLLHSETKSLFIERISIESQNKPAVILTDYFTPYSDTILIGDTIFFHAKVNPPSAKIKSCYWFMEAKEYPCLQARNRFVFDTQGLYPIKLYLLDTFGDTLSASISMRVSSKPVCSNLSLRYFQGSPVFKWNCQSLDTSSELTYVFKLKTENKTEALLLKTDSLQLGYPLGDNWEVHITAENNYGLKAELDSIFKAEAEPDSVGSSP